MNRCVWTGNDELMIKYHDEEWGMPVHDDSKLFEFLILEGAQAGLSWKTVLHKREGYRKAFDNFDYKKIALYDEIKIHELMTNKEIIRNKLKITSAIINAQAFIKIRDEFGSFNNYLYSFVAAPIINIYSKHAEIPAKTPLSDTISKDLIKRGFKFVGSTIIYSFMQATGVVNDHTTDCFRYDELLN